MSQGKLGKYISPIGLWALAFGCSVGWGAFFMPGTTFLPVAGPLGTALGMIIGAVIMIIIGANYAFMMRKYHDAGGTLTYAGETFNNDHGFLSAWFLILAYFAIIWANGTAVMLFLRAMFGNTFQFGFHYTIAGFEIYFGESLISSGLIVFCGLLCLLGKRTAHFVQIVLSCLLMLGILVCFGFVLFYKGGLHLDISPAFSGEKSPILQIFSIVALAPWAFVGFESVSNSAEEIKFPVKKVFGIIIAAVITVALAYILLNTIAAAVLPDGYASWTEYIKDLGSLKGTASIPAFNAIQSTMGTFGLALIFIIVPAAMLTGLIGHYIAASRLLYSASEKGLYPKWFSKTSKNQSPSNAILFIMLISVLVPFLGRTALGWIIDVATIGAAIAYCYTSAAAYKTAKQDGNKLIRITGIVGIIISLFYILYFIIPNIFMIGQLSQDSYLILIVWSILGALIFRFIYAHDKTRKLGKSIVIWTVLFFLIMSISVIWVQQSTDSKFDIAYEELNKIVTEREYLDDSAEDAILQELKKTDNAVSRSNVIQMVLICISVILLIDIFRITLKRGHEMEKEKISAEASSKAKSVFLSNMSHDLRTPMNAIIGYTEIIQQEKGLPENVYDYLRKINISGHHLLDLINDILDLSQIESGKMELELKPTDIGAAIAELYDMFITQMNMKKHTYVVETDDISDRWVMCDKFRLHRVLLNVISNAYKYTPEGGRISVKLTQTGREENVAIYSITVADNGIGMTEEFAKKVFESFEREKDAETRKQQGTGLGMAITKSVVDLMGGTITLKTKKGEGTTFIITVPFEITEAPKEEKKSAALDISELAKGKTVLVVDDNAINRQIAKLILEKLGFSTDEAENGLQAVEKHSSPDTDFCVILMDMQMPEMNGLEATKAIRALENEKKALVPIVALTANAFSADEAAAREAGMNAFITKPFEMVTIIKVLTDLLYEEQ